MSANMVIMAMVVLSLEPPTTRENGAILPWHEIAFFNIYQSGINVAAMTEESIRLNIKDCGLIAITATAVDTDGLESDHSEPAVVLRDCKGRK